MTTEQPDRAKHVLVVDDDAVITRLVSRLLGRNGYEVDSVETGTDAIARVRQGFFGVVVLDVRLPDIDGVSVFRNIREAAPDLPIIYLTSYGSTDLAVETIRDGAFEFIEKTLIFERLVSTVDMAFETLQSVDDRGADAEGSLGGIVTQAHVMRALFRSVRNAIKSNVSVLIHGESGTGKELIARAIHRYGRRKGNPFIAINCAGIPENLLEAELFGHERGAFTGAVSRQMGKFEAASEGSLFLDEIGEMAPVLQAKLLRVLQEGEFQRLGGTSTITTNARIVSATNRDLEYEVHNGTFRADLYYRLAVFTVYVPPLREREGDIPLLVEHFLHEFSRREDKRIDSVDARAMELLTAHPYPGNVRELENIMSYAVVSARSNQLTIADLPPTFLRAVSKGRASRKAVAVESLPQLEEIEGNFPTLEEVERLHVRRALKRADGNKTEAAKLLGVSRMTLYRKLAEIGERHQT